MRVTHEVNLPDDVRGAQAASNLDATADLLGQRVQVHSVKP